MSEGDRKKSLSWLRLYAALVGLALIVVMVFAMFSTRNRPYSNRRLQEQYGPAEQLSTFRDTMRKSIYQGLGEVL